MDILILPNRYVFQRISRVSRNASKCHEVNVFCTLNEYVQGHCMFRVHQACQLYFSLHVDFELEGK